MASTSMQPTKSGSLLYRYKQLFSVVLLAVAHSKYRFIFVDAGSYRKCSDTNIFKTSALSKRIQENILNVPAGKPFDGPCSQSVPYVFVFWG
jgi:hypothetical protein